MSLPPFILVGMPGAGKSHWGRTLAAQHSLRFTDLDSWVEEASGIAPATFLSTGRAVEFRHWEAAGLRAWLANPEGILATGGGTPLVPECLGLLLRFPRVILLTASPQVRLQRMCENPRPLLSGEDPSGMQARLEAERSAIYDAVAKGRVDTEGAEQDVERDILNLASSM